MTKEEPKNQKQKTHKAPKKVFDVVRPGKSPAPPNSRSVIVGHKKQVQDDQFVPESSSLRLAGDPSEKRPLMDSRKKIALKPATSLSDKKSTEPDSEKGEEKTAFAEEATVPPTDSVTDTGKTDDDLRPLTSNSSAGQLMADGLSRSQNETIASEHLADLAIEQMVETPGFDDPASGAGGNSVRDDRVPQDRVQAAPQQSVKAGDDLLAESSAPDLEPQKAIVSSHHSHTGAGQMILIFLLIILVAAVALNFLLDAGILKTELDVPYTDFIR